MVITTAITAFILWRNSVPEQDASLLATASAER
jgi:hypothetical protein